ncbi:MAG: pseudaminic acid synthase [Chlamydiia bacterium]|nr:pseudaminic acid synthase [Chlamydiia bacterium]
MTHFSISSPKGPRRVGLDAPTFVIAEMSANHLGSFERACALVRAAAEAGADAIKLQTYTADSMTIDCEADPFQVKINDAWKGKTLYALYQQAHTPWSWHRPLKELAEELGIIFFSTPFDSSAVDLLEELETPLYKVASLEINYVQLLRQIGAKKKPVIISRGLASPQDIQLAIDTLYGAGATAVTVLHCVSAYPAQASDMHLSTIPELMQRFHCVAGLSDHSLCRSVPVTAVALGARVIEKHLTLARSDGGPDAAFSLEPGEFKTMVQDIRECEASLGTPFIHGENEKAHSPFRRSVMVVRDIAVGETFTEENLRVIRPGFGLEPKELDSLLGKKAAVPLARGTPTTWDIVDGDER